MMTGLLVLGSILGDYLIFLVVLMIISFIVLFKSKGFLNALVMIIVIGTFTGIGLMIGGMFKSSLYMIIISFLFYLASLKLSLMLLKAQGEKIVVTKSSLGDGDEGMPYDNFDDF